MYFCMSSANSAKVPRTTQYVHIYGSLNRKCVKYKNYFFELTVSLDPSLKDKFNDTTHNKFYTQCFRLREQYSTYKMVAHSISRETFVEMWHDICLCLFKQASESVCIYNICPCLTIRIWSFACGKTAPADFIGIWRWAPPTKTRLLRLDRGFQQFHIQTNLFILYIYIPDKIFSWDTNNN